HLSLGSTEKTKRSFQKTAERGLSPAFSERPLDEHSPEILESRSFKLCFLGMRRTIAKSTWAEIHTAYGSGIGLREITRNMGIAEGYGTRTRKARRLDATD